MGKGRNSQIAVMDGTSEVHRMKPFSFIINGECNLERKSVPRDGPCGSWPSSPSPTPAASSDQLAGSDPSVGERHASARVITQRGL